jgi:hypothetical protein
LQVDCKNQNEKRSYLLRSQQSDKSTRRVDMFVKSNKFGKSKVMGNKIQTRCSTNNFEELLEFVMNLKMEVKLIQVLKICS